MQKWMKMSLSTAVVSLSADTFSVVRSLSPVPIGVIYLLPSRGREKSQFRIEMWGAPY